MTIKITKMIKSRPKITKIKRKTLKKEVQFTIDKYDISYYVTGEKATNAIARIRLYNKEK